MGSTVFLSSTCYDLIDVRAEVEMDLEAIGLKPILSDRPSSEFAVASDANSIESCLVNVRQCDYFIVVLSQRYGPSLKKAGYPDISATHLEYLEAKRTKKPIYMYVRDRLEADYNIWKKNKGNKVTLSWVNDKDQGIFQLLEEHRRLAMHSKKSNWVWIFRDSVELRKRIRSDLKVAAGKAILSQLLDTGQTPFLLGEILKCSLESKTRVLSLDFKITNAGTVVAIGPHASLYWDKGEAVQLLKTLLPGQETRIRFLAKLSPSSYKSKNPTMKLDCTYVTPQGHYLGDESYVELAWESGSAKCSFVICGFEIKRYYHSSGIHLDVSDELCRNRE